MVDDAVVLHLAIAANAQGVVARVVGAFPHQEQPRLRRVEEPLGLLPSYLPVKPAGGREERQRGEDKRKGKEKGGEGLRMSVRRNSSEENNSNAHPFCVSATASSTTRHHHVSQTTSLPLKQEVRNKNKKKMGSWQRHFQSIHLRWGGCVSVKVPEPKQQETHRPHKHTFMHTQEVWSRIRS